MFDIIIVTYNAKERLKRCIELVKRHTKNCVITVVDNNSGDGTDRYLRSLDDVNPIFNQKNMGYSGGINVALRHTNNRFIVRLDDDAEVTKDWLFKLYAQIKNRPKVGIVGCKIIFPDKRITSAENRIKPLHVIGYGEIDSGQRNYIRECDAVLGSAWLMRRELIEKVGYFDERFFPSQYEDLDYCLRVRRAGYKIIYNGKVAITHQHLFRCPEKYEINKQRFLRKWKNMLRRYPFKDSHPVDKYIAAGVGLFKKKRFEQALIKFKKAQSQDKKFSDHVYLGMTLYHLGEYKKAIKEFVTLLSLNSNDIMAHYYLAMLYKKTGLKRDWRKEAKYVVGYLHPRASISYKEKIDGIKKAKGSIVIEDFCNTITYYT